MGAAALKKLYMIHGWTYNLEKWENARKALQKRGIETVMLQVPGLTTPSSEVWTMEAYVQWLQGQLSDVESPMVLGHSNGGRIALCYLQQFPGSFSKLILLDSAGVPVQSKAKIVKRKAAYILSKIARPLRSITLLRRLLYKLLGAQDYNNAPPNMKFTMANMLAADKTIDFTTLSVPVSIIWGQNDSVTPLYMGRFMQKAIPGATLSVIDDAGHAPQATHTEQFADIVATILAEQ